MARDRDDPTSATRRAPWRWLADVVVLRRDAPALVAAALALGLAAAFVEISEELGQGELAALDEAVVAWMRAARTAARTQIALDVTALGSPVVLAIVTVLLVLGFLRTGRRGNAVLLAAVAVGAGAWTTALKRFFERVRPDEVFALAAATGLSYPSGHSLASAAIYATVALLVGARARTLADRALVAACTALLLAAIATSRIYLGVHYPSDVVAGLLAGLAWAFASVALASWLAARRRG